MVHTLLRILGGSAFLFLTLAAAMALLTVLDDPAAPGRCLGAGGGWSAVVECLGQAGYGLPARLALGGAGLGLFGGLLGGLRSRAEERDLAGSVRSVLDNATSAGQRGPA